MIGDDMYSRVFAIPKAVYYYCFLPALLIIIACLVFSILYNKKRGTYYYTFTMNYFLEVAGIILSSLLISLLIGYSTASIYTLYINELFSEYILFTIVLVIIPFIPIGLFIWLCTRIKYNMEYKKELDNNLETNVSK